METTKATNFSVAFTRAVLARLRWIVAKTLRNVAAAFDGKSSMRPLLFARLGSGLRFHLTPLAHSCRHRMGHAVELRHHDRQCGLPSTPRRRSITTKSTADLLPPVALGPHPDEVALLDLQP